MKVWEVMQKLAELPAGAEVWINGETDLETVEDVEQDDDGDVRLIGSGRE